MGCKQRRGKPAQTWDIVFPGSYAFADLRRVIAEDLAHSENEKRYFCFGEVEGGILTVRFTCRGNVIRIFGAGYWRKGKVIYEHNNQIHK